VPQSRIRSVQRHPDSRPGPVLVVLGYHEFAADGSHGISEICRAGVRRAEALAAAVHPRAVIFTGWSSTGGPSEADQMAAAWSGPEDVEVIRETTASNTAENAVRSLAMLPALDGSTEVIVVCSVRHFPRVRYLFGAPFRRHGYRVRYTYVSSPLPSAGLWRHELSSITRMVRDRRAALGLLPEAPSVATPQLSEAG
jgi:uncharacterized SAM-binding protein YcdF (DUF218 family)